MLAHVALIRGDQVGLLAFSDRIRAYVPPGGGPRRINRLVHSVHNVFPELVEPRYDRAFVELEKRCRKRSLVVLMTNLFDDVNAQIVADHLGNLVGRHLPLRRLPPRPRHLRPGRPRPRRRPRPLPGRGRRRAAQLARARPGRPPAAAGS